MSAVQTNRRGVTRSWSKYHATVCKGITHGICIVTVLAFAAAAPGQTPQDVDYFLANSVPDEPGGMNFQALLRNVDTNHTEKAAASIARGDIHIAIEDLNYTLARFPNHPKALMLFGAAARLSGRPTLAITYYERALSLYPQYALTHAQYGGYLLQIGRVDQAIERLKKAIEIDQSLAIAYVWLSEAYTKSGKPEMAQQAAEQARQLGYRPTQRTPIQ